MKYLVLSIVVVLVLLLSTFGIQNPIPVNIRFLGLQTGSVPLYIVVLLSTLIGVLVAVLLALPGRVQRRLELRRSRQRVADLERELTATKAQLPPPVMKHLPE